MTRRITRFFGWLIISTVSVNVLLATVTNVPTEMTASDDAFFRTEFGLIKSQAPLSYEQEIALIRSLQALVLNEVSVTRPIPNKKTREPEDWYRFKSGVCYDRSRTLDKLLLWHGFESRHIYILYGDELATGERVPFWQAAITKKTGSHAGTEVKTTRGWLFVDSLAPWTSYTADGVPIAASNIYLNANRFESIPEHLNRPFWSIPGLYSRHGNFYPPFLPYPELNWFDFIHSLMAG